MTTALRHDGSRHAIIAGAGVWLTLADGRRVIDASNTGCPLGHGHPAMVAALRGAESLPVVKDEWFWPPREAAASAVAEIAFAGEDSWFGAVRFCLSGNEANELALQLAQALTGRAMLVTRERAYHGATGLALAATPQPHLHGGMTFPGGRTLTAPPAAPLRIIPAPPVLPAPGALDGAAAVIVDVSQGGIYHDAAWQDHTASLAGDAGALWIADEVVTGQARTGSWFGFQGGPSRPDIVTMGKSLAGGHAPCGAVVLSRRVLDMMGDAAWMNSSTFRGHPVAMLAVSACLRAIRDLGLPARVAGLHDAFRTRLAALAQRHACVARVDGRGLHWTIELHGPGFPDQHWRGWTGDPAADTPAMRVAAAALDAGAQIGTSGEAASLFLAPPLVINDAEVAALFDALEAGLAAA